MTRTRSATAPAASVALPARVRLAVVGVGLATLALGGHQPAPVAPAHGATVLVAPDPVAVDRDTADAVNVQQDDAWPGRPDQNPSAQIGRLFFDTSVDRLTGREDVEWSLCSATVVSSDNGSTIVTAGHCVYQPDPGEDGTVDGDGYYYEHFLFCPGFDGDCGLGMWWGRDAIVTSGYMDRMDHADDTAFVILEDHPAADVPAVGEGTVQDAVGAQGIAFNQDAFLVRDAFGYPLTDERWPEYDYSGDELVHCLDIDTPYEDGTLGVHCTMTGGASGGPWIIDQDGDWIGYVNSVNSWKPSGDELRGPYFGDAEMDIYTWAQAA